MTKDLPIDKRTKEMLDREFGMPPSEKDRCLEYARSYVSRGDGDRVVRTREDWEWLLARLERAVNDQRFSGEQGE